MRALVLKAFGLENLHYGETAEPDSSTLGPSEVLLHIHASSLNSRDLRVVSGDYDPRFPLPLVPCSDAAGRVVALGAAVTDLELGDRVLPAFAPRWLSGPPDRDAIRQTWGAPLAGTATEQLVVPASCLVQSPRHLDDVEASTLCCAGATAYRALVELPGLTPSHTALQDQWVLCLGTGGVSVFAVQLAKALGAKVAVTSSSDDKLEQLQALGADLTINYRKVPSFGRYVKSATGGVHHVIEVGGAHTLDQSLRAVVPGGTVSLIGVLSGAAGAFNLLPAVMNQVRMQGVLVGPRETLANVVAFFEKHELHPYVHRTYALADGVAAFRDLESQRHVGKIGLRV